MFQIAADGSAGRWHTPSSMFQGETESTFSSVMCMAGVGLLRHNHQNCLISGDSMDLQNCDLQGTFTTKRLREKQLAFPRSLSAPPLSGLRLTQSGLRCPLHERYENKSTMTTPRAQFKAPPPPPPAQIWEAYRHWNGDVKYVVCISWLSSGRIWHQLQLQKDTTVADVEHALHVHLWHAERKLARVKVMGIGSTLCGPFPADARLKNIIAVANSCKLYIIASEIGLPPDAVLVVPTI
jgi:hypothetical protein